MCIRDSYIAIPIREWFFLYLKPEDDEMKKVGFTIEIGKTEDEKERGKNFVSGIEALARMTEKRFSAAVNDAGLEFDAYVDALDEISSLSLIHI